MVRLRWTPKNRIGILGSVLGFAALYYFLSDYWISITVVGIALVILGLLLPTEEKNEALMNLPDQWNEAEIERSLIATKSNPNVLTQVLEHISNRFLLGQQIEVAKKRIEYLELFLKQANLERQVYGWQQSIKNRLIEQEEEERPKEFGRKTDIAELEYRRKREELLTAIADAKKRRRELKKAPTQEPEPKTPSADEQRQQKRKEAERIMEEVEKEMRVVEANPTLSAEQKTRKLNQLSDKLDEIEQERLRWL